MRYRTMAALAAAGVAVAGTGLGVGLTLGAGGHRTTTATSTSAPATTVTPGQTTASTSSTTTTPPSPRRASTSVGKVVTVSDRCPAQNAEVENAAYLAKDEVFEDWIGCRGIEFARSTDGGRSFGAPMLLPGSLARLGGPVQQSWDPAVAVAPDGTVYASFMTSRGGHMYPVVEASFDGGASFTQSAHLVPRAGPNWGDRDFVAAGAGGKVYVSGDYGPSRSEVRFVCPPGGSCGFTAGDLNVVVQESTDRGKTFGPMHHVGAGFPAQGGDSAPLLVQPDGSVDLIYQGHAINRSTLVLGPSRVYFASSRDGGATWSAPVPLGPPGLRMATAEWWIDGSLGTDTAGDIYVTWDTQGAGGDVGWLTYSTDHGATWSPLIRATPDVDGAPHIVEVAGEGPGRADVGWLSSAPGGWALYLRPFSVAKGWLSAPVRVSPELGASAIWPGDTFGITSLQSHDGAGSGVTTTDIALTWGSALASRGLPLQSAIIGTVATLTAR